MAVFRVWATVLALGMVEPAVAETVYRSVDAEGRVTFSGAPPADAASTESVELLPPLSEERRRQSEERQRRLLDLANEGVEAERERQAERAQSVEQAQQRVEQARGYLRDARVIRPEDWVGGAGSGVLAPEYYERIRAAEKDVKAAERELRRTRSGQL